MEKYNISKDKLFYYLTNKNCIDQGINGIVSKFDDDTLIKIYYKDLFEVYNEKNINKLDKIVDDRVEILELLGKNKKKTDELDLKKSELLESIGYLKNEVYYRNLKVGILMKYYKDYIKLSEIYNKLNTESQKYIIKLIKEKIEDLIDKNLYMMDIKEDNIMVNPNTLEVVFIDLDDYLTRYEEQEYITEHNLNLNKICTDKYKEMVKRLK